ncbi:MAG: UDP-glucose dehydrogenase family protein [Bacteroides sp.]
MNIAVVGVGYVGLVSGACFAELGSTVYCIDNNHEKISQLKNGVIPIYEPGLEHLVARNVQGGRLYFRTELAEILDEVEIVFIAVGTPMREDGSADLSYVLEVATTIGKNLTNYKLVVNKSTVPVGTAATVNSLIRQELNLRGVSIDFDVASNPEFLKEGAAIEDFMRPDRVVVGVDSVRAQELMTRLYKPMLLNNFRVLFMDVPSAEMTKYAANAMLATRISFMNELANLCEIVGANISSVRTGIGSDARIGNRFLYAGCGYGGSCLPKDVSALIATGREYGSKLEVLTAVQHVNSLQKEILFTKYLQYYNRQIQGQKVAIWGLAFKPETDDMREAPSLRLIEQLLEYGNEVCVYDPVAMPTAKLLLGDSVLYANDLYQCVEETYAIFHVTEWKEFRMPNWQQIRRLVKVPLIIDGRNVFDPKALEGFTYLHIG